MPSQTKQIPPSPYADLIFCFHFFKKEKKLDCLQVSDVEDGGEVVRLRTAIALLSTK